MCQCEFPSRTGPHCRVCRAHNTTPTGKYVRKGNQNLRDAIESQKKARKCMCCLMSECVGAGALARVVPCECV